MPLPIEDYAIIGDTHTAAVVGRDGSIDWLCLPRFDSEACFAGLLGDDSHGHWRLAPSVGGVATTRRYLTDTLVLESEWVCDEGVVRVIDCMPIRETHPEVVRLVEGVSGAVTMRVQIEARFGYGQTTPWAHRTGGVLVFTAGADALAVWTPVHLQGRDMRHQAEFTVRAGQQVPFVLTWFPSHEDPPRPTDARFVVEETAEWWRGWTEACTVEGEYRDAVVRSLITLKALTYQPTGGIVAAATTSLPEALGGERNWDYRYCWLRDATLTLTALIRGGYHEEAMAWRDWLLRAAAGDVQDLQIMYGPAGERRLDEWEADWLPGYEGSKPVRIGNAAAGQFQLDVYGEVISAMYESSRLGDLPTGAAWDLEVKLIEFVERHWKEPDDGIWEVRGPRRHFTHSKVMAWAAVDRALLTMTHCGYEGPFDRWTELRDEIHADICKQAWNEQVGAFTQYYGSDQLDASLLMIPLVGFLPATDPRVVATVEAIQRDLTEDGFVLRYRAADAHDVDGLRGREGAFLACSFWMADCLGMIGRTDDAKALMARLLALRNDLGLLSEEYDAIAKRQVGNFPQAFSHVSLVNAACNLMGESIDLRQPQPESLKLVRRALGRGRGGTARMRGRSHALAHGRQPERSGAAGGTATPGTPAGAATDGAATEPAAEHQGAGRGEQADKRRSSR